MQPQIKERERAIYNQGYGKHDILPSHDLMERLLADSHAWINDRLARFPVGSSVLDIGCGAGLTSFDLARRGFRVTGIDISDILIGQARGSAKEQGLSIEFRVGDAENPGFQSESFDLIHCASILHHLPAVAEDIQKYEELLKPGGSILTFEPGLLNPFAFIRRKFFPTSVHTPDEHPFIPRMLISDFRKEFAEVDFGLFYITNLLSPIFQKLLGDRAGDISLRLLAPLDQVLTRIPGVRQLSWIITVQAMKD